MLGFYYFLKTGSAAMLEANRWWWLSHQLLPPGGTWAGEPQKARRLLSLLADSTSVLAQWGPAQGTLGGDQCVCRRVLARSCGTAHLPKWQWTDVWLPRQQDTCLTRAFAPRWTTRGSILSTQHRDEFSVLLPGDGCVPTDKRWCPPAAAATSGARCPEPPRARGAAPRKSHSNAGI